MSAPPSCNVTASTAVTAAAATSWLSSNSTLLGPLDQIQQGAYESLAAEAAVVAAIRARMTRRAAARSLHEQQQQATATAEEHVAEAAAASTAAAGSGSSKLQWQGFTSKVGLSRFGLENQQEQQQLVSLAGPGMFVRYRVQLLICDCICGQQEGQSAVLHSADLL